MADLNAVELIENNHANIFQRQAPGFGYGDKGEGCHAKANETA